MIFKHSIFLHFPYNFLDKAGEDLNKIGIDLINVEQLYKTVSNYFAGDPKSMQPEEFFQLIWKFVYEFQVSWQILEYDR